MPLTDNAVKFPPRILVVLEPYPEGARLLRAAKRKAELAGLDWEVLVIETPRMQHGFTPEEKKTFLSLITLAGQMGAIITKVHARSMLDAVTSIVNTRMQEGIAVYSVKTGLVRGRYNWLGLREPIHIKLQKHLPAGIRISAIPLGTTRRNSYPFIQFLHIKGREILISLFAVFVAIGFIEASHFLAPALVGDHTQNETVIFMTACAFAAGQYGLIAGLTASVVSFLMLNLLYVPPYFSFAVTNQSDAANLTLFMFATFIISLLGSRDYDSKRILARRSELFHSLLQIHRFALNKNTPAEAITVLNEELKALLGKQVAFFLPGTADPKKLETLVTENLNNADLKALKVCWEESKTTGVGAPYEPEGCTWRFEPMVTSNDEIGVFGIRISGHDDLGEDFGRLMSGIADQTALIIERLQFEQVAEENKIQAEKEKLRAMLLSSVSHDLKTPLASVIGSLSVFRSMGKNLSEEHRITLLNTAIDEAQRLDSFITNILDMTRIESGQIELKNEWMKPKDMVSEVTKRLRDRIRNHQLRINSSDNTFEICMDTVMTCQVLQNILDNAVKYTKPGTTIDIDWNVDEAGKFHLNVRDYGPGIPEGHLEKIFDKYARIKRQDSQVAGTGLGLAIARAVMRAQGGDIFAINHADGGAMFTLVFPCTRRNGTLKVA